MASNMVRSVSTLAPGKLGIRWTSTLKHASFSLGHGAAGAEAWVSAGKRAAGSAWGKQSTAVAWQPRAGSAWGKQSEKSEREREE